MKELPIGYIDSGYGGLTVIKQAMKQLPNESIIYIGDSGRAPYGPRPFEEVKRFTWQLANFLREKGIKMLVIACNTATAATLDELRKILSIPVIGVIHSGSRSAIKQTRNNKIGVIGTQGTIHSGMYEDVMLEKNNHLQIFSRPCPEFVEIVEEDRIDEAATQDIIQKRLAPFKEDGIDILVLGCTHYPLLYHQIKKYMGEEVTLIDSGVETINEVSTILDYYHLSRSAKEALANPPTVTIYTTGHAEIFQNFAQKWLQVDNLKVNEVVVKGEIVVENNHS